MSNEELEQAAKRISIADISSAIAFGLQRAIDARNEKTIFDKIIEYGGRLDFNVRIIPQGVRDVIKETAAIGKG